MKKIYSTVLLFFIVCSSFAQVPAYWNYNNIVGGNAFPFGTTSSRKVQWRINANSLGAVTAGNNITTVYFMCAGSGSNTYPLINIRLKQGVTQFAGGGNYEVGMTLVYTGTGVTCTGVGGGWLQFTLQTPFLYDPNQPLLVEVEHNATSGTGPTMCQTSPTGPGFGRLYGNYPSPTYTGADQTVVHFGIDVIPATPCTGFPITNTIIPSSYSTCPMIANPSLSMAATYSFGGLTYLWQASNISAVGPYTTIPGATLAVAPIPTIGVTTWFQAVVTCTNPGGGSTTLTPTQFSVAGSVVSSVPYFEDFEGIQSANRLPNCSWYAPNLGNTVGTYMNAQSNNRVPNSGTKFGSFSLPSTNNYVYSNGITMSPGITYSAGISYATEYFGYNNWSSLTILVGPNQSPTGMVPIATIAPAVSGPYKLLSGTFSVPSAGDYYIAFRANSTTGAALYLSFDDLFVMIPCYGAGAANNPNLISSASSNTICAGEPLSISASGADTYLWSDGTVGPIFSNTLASSSIVTVVGTNTLTGCAVTNSINMTVNPTPNVFVIADKIAVCKGENAYLTAYGADIYSWNTGGSSTVIAVSPLANTSYTVIGTNLFSCPATAAISIAVKPSPTITSFGSGNESCPGEMVTMQATGGATYKWFMSSNAQLLQGSSVNAVIFTTTTFSVYGEGTNGCTSLSTVVQNVGVCNGIDENGNTTAQFSVYPNPSSGLFNVELSNGVIQSATVTDLSGRVVLEGSSMDGKMSLDLSTLPNGVYFAKVYSEGNMHMIKLIKE